MIVDRFGKQIKEDENQNNLLQKLYGTSLGRCALKILVSKPISVLGGLYMSSPLSIRRIKPFIEENNINMDDYENKNYRSYNDFFTRKIKQEKRLFDKQDNILVAPADSKLTYYPINEETILKIKNSMYSVNDLVDNPTLASKYIGGSCLVFRLTVDDYHRYSYIDNGNVESNKYISGIFHTVNPIAMERYKIYKRNSREITVTNTDNFGKVTYIEVGAMMVGKIVNHKIEAFYKGQEKGYFEFGGSTIVLLFQKDEITLDEDIINNSKKDIETRVLLGQKIGHGR